MDIVTNLADPLRSPFALFESRWVPGQVDIHLSAETLKVKSLTRRIGGTH